MDIDTQQIESALYQFLSEKVQKDPDFLNEMMMEVAEDQLLLRLMKETQGFENKSVSLASIYDELAK